VFPYFLAGKVCLVRPGLIGINWGSFFLTASQVKSPALGNSLNACCVAKPGNAPSNKKKVQLIKQSPA